MPTRPKNYRGTGARFVKKPAKKPAPPKNTEITESSKLQECIHNLGPTGKLVGT